MDELLALACELIEKPSITPQDAGCQALLMQRLQALGFTTTEIPFDQTQNLWARFGDQEPLIVFAGHTDVVPTGSLSDWHYPPFTPTVADGFLYGRGSADMKGSLAAMIIAVTRFLQTSPNPACSIGFLITSAEEGPAQEGTPIVLDYLTKHGITIDYCIVGEPTSQHELGDMIKNGRRGSLTGKLQVIGKQGHIAYPHLADNPIHNALAALSALTQTQWDKGNADFQPTSLQISNIHGGTGAGNVIPGTLDVLFNFRYSPAVTAELLEAKVQQILAEHNVKYTLEWTHFGEPYHTHHADFLAKCTMAIKKITGQNSVLSTSGGTSDARYIAKFCDKIIEMGPCNQTIHQINECVRVADLHALADVYLEILQVLC